MRTYLRREVIHVQVITELRLKLNVCMFYRKLVPNSKVHVLDDIGHYPQWEAPKETMQAILDFMDTIETNPQQEQDMEEVEEEKNTVS